MPSTATTRRARASSVDAGGLKREEALQPEAAKMAGKAVKYHRNFTLGTHECL